MTETITIPDKPDFSHIKLVLKYLQDMVMERPDRYGKTPLEMKATILEETIRIWRELNEIEKIYETQSKGARA